MKAKRMNYFYLVYFCCLSSFLYAQGTTTLVAYYPFSGNANDSLQMNHAVNQGAVLTDDINGNCHAAYRLSGWDDNQRLYISDPIITMNQDFTINLWFYVDSINPNASQVILSSRHDSLGNEAGGVDLGLSTNNELLCRLRRLTPFNTVGAINSNPLNTKQWYMLTLKQEGLDVSLYLDGVLVQTITLSSYADTSPFWNIGTLNNTNGLLREFNGTIDELRFYTGALSASQITNLYAQTSQGDNLKHYYPFDGNVLDVIAGADGINDGALSTTDMQGMPNGAYAITGWDNNQRIYINQPLIEYDQDFTINIWFYVDSINPTNGQIILSSRLDSLGNEAGGIDLGLSANNELLCRFRRINPFSTVGAINSNPLNTKQWYMLTLKQEGLDISLYLDGALVQTITLTNYATTGAFWNVGAGFNLSGIVRELNGKVDDLRFYCQALDSTDIANLYDMITPIQQIATKSSSSLHIQVYPNPTNNIIQLELETTAAAQVKIVNVLGQAVKTLSLEGAKQYQLALKNYQLETGLYYLWIETKGRQQVYPVYLY